jgi:hypothetical protein
VKWTAGQVVLLSLFATIVLIEAYDTTQLAKKIGFQGRICYRSVEYEHMTRREFIAPHSVFPVSHSYSTTGTMKNSSYNHLLRTGLFIFI